MPLLTRIIQVPGSGRRPWGNERGFTLIETILSLSILVVMIGLVLSAMRLGQRSWEKGEHAMDDAAQRRFVVKRVSSDVASMYLYRQVNNGTDGFLFYGSEGKLGFVTSHHAGSMGMPWGGVSYVLYSTGEQGLVVTEKTVPFAEGDKGGYARSFVLAPDINRVTFRYLGDSGWNRKWDAKVKKRLPLAVRAEFFFRDRTEPLVVTAPVWASHESADDTPRGTGNTERNDGHV